MRGKEKERWGEGGADDIAWGFILPNTTLPYLTPKLGISLLPLFLKTLHKIRGEPNEAVSVIKDEPQRDVPSCQGAIVINSVGRGCTGIEVLIHEDM